MSPADKWCVAAFLLGLVILAGWMVRQSYLRANPKPRGPQNAKPPARTLLPFTRWQDGRAD